MIIIIVAIDDAEERAAAAAVAVERLREGLEKVDRGGRRGDYETARYGIGRGGGAPVSTVGSWRQELKAML